MAIAFNKKTAFSLIEILQTIVLIGIIAGISISFFRSINTDKKLRNSTEIMLYQAIKEANRQICTDTTPICLFPADLTNYRFVRGAYPASSGVCAEGAAYNPNNGFCVQTRPATGCPAGTEEHTTDRITNTRSCISEPTQCNGVAGSVVIPAYKALCVPDSTTNTLNIQWNARLMRNIDGETTNNADEDNQVNEICYRLWDLINHLPQGNSLFNDLQATCVTQTNPCFENNTNLNARSCSAPTGSTEPNMILPNGVRLYNLSSLGFFGRNNVAEGNVEDHQHIYIKYDRNPQIQTHNLSTTTSMFNAVVFGQPNNIRQAKIKDTPSNTETGLTDEKAIPQAYITEVNGGNRGSNTVPIIPTSIEGLLRADGVIK